MNYKNIITEWIFPIIVAIILALMVNKFAFYKITVPSGSMYPTIKVGDNIIVTRIYNRNKLKRGDVVVFYSKELNDKLVKRLIGLPGDQVEVKDNGVLFINGIRTDEPYVVNKDSLKGIFKVPEDCYLFFGDNRPSSNDSRRWENPYIEGKEIQGKAQFIVYPFRRFGELKIGSEALNH